MNAFCPFHSEKIIPKCCQASSNFLGFIILLIPYASGPRKPWFVTTKFESYFKVAAAVLSGPPAAAPRHGVRRRLHRRVHDVRPDTGEEAHRAAPRRDPVRHGRQVLLRAQGQGIPRVSSSMMQQKKLVSNVICNWTSGFYSQLPFRPESCQAIGTRSQ